MKTDVLLSIMAIASALFLVGGSTYAYFNDVEVAEGNTFTTGTLNLKVGDDDECTETMTFSNLKPGDSNDSAAIWLISNEGSIAGNLSVKIDNIINNENVITEPERESGDTTVGGELGAYLRLVFWMDVDQSGGWTAGDYCLLSNGTTESHGNIVSLDAVYDTLNNFNETWPGVQNSVAGGADFGQFIVAYTLLEGVGNTIQSDNCTFNISFTLDQDRSP